MRNYFARYLAAIAVAVMLISLAGPALAQNAPAAQPKFVTLPIHPNPYKAATPATTGLPQWTFTFTYNGSNYSDVFVGTDPSKTNTTTNIKWGIIPLKMVFGSSNGNMTFDSDKTGEFGTLSATQMVNSSLLFQSLVDYNQGGTDLGTTQYEDAYQRGDFWEYVQSNNNYHILFPKAVIAPEQTLNVPPSQGSVITNPWSGVPVGQANINWVDEQLQIIMAKFKQVQPDTFPIFIAYNTYLGGCGPGCYIGGYHSANAGPPDGQTYAFSSIMEQDGSTAVFSQDISALSHEIGEWIMDPFTTNNSPCGILEVGDPLETEPNFGDYPYTVSGFTYHPQDLVFIDYFGASTSLTVNGWYTFQNETNADTVCVRGS